MRLTNIPILILTTVMFWGCSAHKTNQVPERIRKLKNLTVIPAGTKPAYQIKFVPETTFRASDSVSISEIEEIAVDSKNRVYVASPFATIYVFDPDGHYVTHLGREGRGPGEFRNVPEIQIQSNRLYAYDNALRRIEVFSLDPPAFTRSIIISPDKWRHVRALQKSWFRHFFAKKDGTFLMGFTRSVMSPKYYRYFQADSTGKVTSGQIFQRRYVNFTSGLSGPPAPPVAVSPRNFNPELPSSGRSLMAVSGDGHIFSAWSEDFLIREYDSKGDYLRAVYYPYKKSPLNPNDIINHYKGGSAIFRNAVRNANFPKTWPALSYLLVDDQNRLWVATIGNDKNHYEWWVLNPSGKLLAKFTWPGKRINRLSESVEIRVIKNGFLYAFKKDSTANTDEIVKYRIVMQPNLNTSQK